MRPALAALGVRKGDRVALLLPNCPQFLIAEFGAWKAGAVVVALNPTYSERELEHALDSMRVETAVTLTPFYERLKRVQGQNRRAARHRHLHQGVPAAAAEAALHAVS